MPIFSKTSALAEAILADNTSLIKPRLPITTDYVIGLDHLFEDSASYVTKMAGPNQPSHSLVTQYTAKCDFGLSKNLSDEK